MFKFTQPGRGRVWSWLRRLAGKQVPPKGPELLLSVLALDDDDGDDDECRGAPYTSHYAGSISKLTSGGG